MGKPLSEQTLISHFSHPHPLTLTNLPQSNPNLPCSACKLPTTTGPVYACLSCSFILHPKCFQLSQQINHPVDKNHSLSLHAKPVYSEGLFRCDACGNPGDGFSYHCSPCEIDLHTVCALLPMELHHHCHDHPLGLSFSAPYDGNKFSCDVCKSMGSKTWIYRCSHNCDFDAHLTCVVADISRASTRIQHQVFAQVSAPTPPSSAMNPPIVGGYGGPAGQPQTRLGSGLRDQMVVAAVNGITGGIAESATQVFLQELTGSSGGATADAGSYSGGGYGGQDGGSGGGEEHYY